MLYSVIILSLALPVCTISAFIVGYNVNARTDQKVFVRKPKPNEKKRKDEETMDFIDNFHA